MSDTDAIISNLKGSVAKKDREITTLRAEVERLKVENEAVLSANRDVMLHWDVLKADYDRLRAVLDLYREAVRIDVTMEGPRFMGSNASALKRAWDADRAALEEK